MMLDVFSEHKVVIGNLLSLHANNQLPHAALITSVSGVGLTSAASSLCATLLCKRNDDEPCGECSSSAACQLVRTVIIGGWKSLRGKRVLG